MTRAILTCSPLFTEAALHEVRRAHPGIVELERAALGYFFLEAPGSFGKLTEPWQHHLPIYLHHLFPVHHIVSLTRTRDDLACLCEAAHKIAPRHALVQVRAVPGDQIAYSCADVEQAITNAPPIYCVQPPSGRVLSILIGQKCAYLGVSWAAQNISPFAGGQIPITEPVSNRAGYKLIEALHTFDIRLRRGDSALDLGAAPGAWTTLLRRRGLSVTAVAPAPLYPWLMYDTGVHYQPMLAEEYLTRCTTSYNLIVNDMKLDAQDSARLMVDYARHLRSGGIAVMTLKLRSRNRLQVIDQSLRLLRKAYKIIRVRQLVANKQEITLFLRRKE